jgi:hypothetical protein
LADDDLFFVDGAQTVSGAVAPVGAYKIVSIDSRSGYSSGYFTELNAGEEV